MRIYLTIFLLLAGFLNTKAQSKYFISIHKRQPDSTMITKFDTIEANSDKDALIEGFKIYFAELHVTDQDKRNAFLQSGSTFNITNASGVSLYKKLPGKVMDSVIRIVMQPIWHPKQ
jgi:hypothetical protein